MTAFVRAALIILFAATTSGRAAALCTGATLKRDFHDADLVIRARVVAETRVVDDEPSPAHTRRWGEYSPVVLNRLRVLDIFKGKPGPTVAYFQEIDSGRFDLDIGQEYLLFLTYHRPYRGSGSIVRGATFVKHACGQSKLWREVGPQEIGFLRSTARRR